MEAIESNGISVDSSSEEIVSDENVGEMGFLDSLKPAVEAFVFNATSPISADQIAKAINKRLVEIHAEEIAEMQAIQALEVQAETHSEPLEEQSQEESAAPTQDEEDAPSEKAEGEDALSPEDVQSAEAIEEEKEMQAVPVPGVRRPKKATPGMIKAIVRELMEEYSQSSKLIEILEIADGYQFFTKPGFGPWVKKSRESEKEDALSPAALETLAIIAYRQPISRAEVESIRGVGCGQMIRNLIDKKLVKIVGRNEDLGRSLLYGTTKDFMEIFGLRSMSDLPKLDET